MELLSWIVFAAVVATLLTLDIMFTHRGGTVQSIRKAAAWSALFVGTGLAFSLFVGYTRGTDAALAYLTALLIEQSLSVDNLFVFLALFTYFNVAGENQHRVLFWGILGALVMRGVFIFVGLALIARFQALTYLLGAFLILTGIRFAKQETEVQPDKNPVVRFFREIVPVTATPRGQRFFVHERGRWHATPLFVVLLVVELTDVIFATDSVPAVLAISKDPFIVYSSNVFAILGLRALYFVLAGAMRRFAYLRYGLSAILIFVGFKMLIHELYHVPISFSLGVIGLLLAFSVFLSVVRKNNGGCRV